MLFRSIGTSTGGVMVFASGKSLQVTNNTFRYSSAGTALGVSDATNATVSGNRFTDNGGVGTGINKQAFAQGLTFVGGAVASTLLQLRNHELDEVLEGAG